MGTLASDSAGRLDPDAVRRAIGQRGRAAVALSGGVDSSVVLALARRALGPDVTAVTLVSAAVGHREVEGAQQVAALLRVPHVLLPVDPLSVEGYRTNPDNRCYFCRRTESREMLSWGRTHGVLQYLDGVHRDDLGDDRPGLRALEEAGVRHPLLDAGWGKKEVREHARELRLPNWDAPSEACLASRIPHGQPITLELLGRVERAEAAVHALGFRRVRVRVELGGARVVVDPSETLRLRSPPTADAVERQLRAEGFERVLLDPDGYRPRVNG